MNFSEKLERYKNECIPEMHKVLSDLVAIPAPSHHEEKRAEFCKKWLEAQGAEGVYIDEAFNCVYPINCEEKDDIVVFMAHTDTVFPDTTPFELKSDGKKFYAPGVGDDTACLVMMLMITKFILENGIKSDRGILIVANACEEGLGNLKGTKQLMKDYQGRVKEFYTFDGEYSIVCSECVGSHRYEVECRTEGGHSYESFGNINAIIELSKLICELAKVEIPQKEGVKTTFNVGTIEGGTSVNTIAQSAKMLYEYRSNDAESLEYMKNFFEKTIEEANACGKGEFSVDVIGIRPCGGEVDKVLHESMIQKVINICEKHTGIPCKRDKGSTDCNVPMSMGIAAVCVGSYMGGGAHTREEWIEIDSLPKGIMITGEIMLDYFNH